MFGKIHSPAASGVNAYEVEIRCASVVQQSVWRNLLYRAAESVRCVACVIFLLCGFDTIAKGEEISRPQWPKEIRRAKSVTPADREEDRLRDLRSHLRTTKILKFEKSEPASERTVPASLVQDAIMHEGATFFVNVIVEGRLNCSYGLYEKGVELIDCQFKGEVDFRFAMFRQELTLDGSIFEKGLDLGFAIVENNLNLTRTRFAEGVFNLTGFRCHGFILGNDIETAQNVTLNLDLCDVANGVVFSATKFNGPVSCAKGKFGGLVMLAGVQFNQGANFAMSAFDGLLNVRPTGLSPEPSVEGGFAGVANFRGVHFKEGAAFAVNFDEAKFDGASSERDLFIGVPDPVPAEWNYTGKVAFGGKASFRGIRARRLVVGGVQFKESTDFSEMSITQDLRFDGDHDSHEHPMFLRSVLFSDTRVGGRAVFVGCGFGSDVDFRSADVGFDLVFEEDTDRADTPPIFGGEARFERVRVGDSLEFNSRRFDHPLRLNDARIGGILSFEGEFEGKPAPIVFKNEVDVTGARITRSIEICGAKFEGPFRCELANIGAIDFCVEGAVKIDPPVFLDHAYFSGSRLDWAWFKGAMFKKEAHFDNMNINRAASFEGVTFEGPVSFRATQVSGPVGLEGVKFGKVTFRDSTFQSLSFRSRQDPEESAEFGGPIDLRGCTYGRIEVDWRALVARIEPYDRQAYAQLQKALHAAGEPNDAAGVYQARITKEVNGRPLRWIAYVVPWISVRPSLVAKACIFVVALGMLLFGVVPRSFQAVSSEATSRLGMADTEKPRDSIFRRWFVRWSGALALSVRYFLPFDTPAGMNWVPRQGAGTTIATSLRISGWVLLAMIIAAVSGLFRATL